MNRLWVLLVALLFPMVSFAQGNSAHPTGQFVPGHALRANTSSGSPYSDAGGSAGSSVLGSGYLTELGITNTGTPLCINDALINAPGGYHQFCLGANALGGGLINYGALGGATPEPLRIYVNGVDILDLNSSGINLHVPFIGTSLTLDTLVVNTSAIVPTPSPGDNSNHAATTAWVDTAIGAAGVTPIPIVTTTAALQALSTGTTNRALRTGVLAEGDAAPLLFVAGSGVCSVAASGTCVNSSNGNKWLSRPTTPDGIDAREFGAIAGVDDTTTLQAIDTAACSADWPAGIAKTALWPQGNVAVGNLNLACSSLKGTGSYQTQIIPAPGLTPSGGYLVKIKAGGLSVEGVSFACATYADAPGLFVAPAACPHWQLVVAADDTTQRLIAFKERDVRFIGGDIQFESFNVEGLDIDGGIEHWWPFSFGLIDSDFLVNGTNAVAGSHIHVDRCYVPGQYCISTPANTNGSASNQVATRAIWIQLDDCTGAGWTTNNFKGCLDNTGTALDESHVKLVSHNSYFAAEFKRTDDATNVSPNGIRKVYAEIVADTTMDTTAQILLAYENPTPTSTAEAWRGVSLKASMKGALPLPRLATTFYPTGYTYKSGNGRTYLVVKGGITDGSSGPAGITAGTGYADGTAIVSHVQVTPGFVAGTLVPAFINTSAVQLEALSQVDLDIDVQGLAFGIRLFPTGSSDNTIRDVTARVRGITSRGCIVDQAIPRIGTGQAIDQIHFDASNCRTVGNFAAISIGGTGANPIDWTNCSITGSRFSAPNGSTSFGLRSTGGSIDCDIVGSSLTSFNSAIYAEGPTTIRFSGGQMENTGGSGLTAGVISGQAGSSGLIELSGTRVKNANTTIGTVNIAAGTMDVQGQVMNEASATAPTRACTTGVDYAPGTVPTTAYLWLCKTTDTWVGIVSP